MLLFVRHTHFKFPWGAQKGECCEAACFFPWKHSPGRWTTHVRCRVMGYKVTLMHLSFSGFHLTARPLIASQGGFTQPITDSKLYIQV